MPRPWTLGKTKLIKRVGASGLGELGGEEGFETRRRGRAIQRPRRFAAKESASVPHMHGHGARECRENETDEDVPTLNNGWGALTECKGRPKNMCLKARKGNSSKSQIEGGPNQPLGKVI